MAVISRRTIGQIILAYDDGVSPPTEILPIGSLVSVADGTLWISQGSGVYASVGNPQNYPDVASLPTPVPNAGTVASIGPGTPIARRTFYVSDGTQWLRAPDNAGLRYAASSLALLPGSNDGAQDGDQAFVSGSLTGVAIRSGGNWLWGSVRAPDKASLPLNNATGALAYELLGGVGYVWSGSAWVRLPALVEYQYEGSTLASLPGAAEGVLDGDVAKLTGGSVTGEAIRSAGVWVWTKAVASSLAGLPSSDVSPSAIGVVGETLYVRLGTEWVLPPQFAGVYASPLFYPYNVPFIVDSFGLTNQPVIP